MNPKRQDSEDIQQKISTAIEHLKAGCSCSESVLLTYGPQLGLEQKLAVKIASGFGGGMGMGATCGAVTASIMVIGLQHGPASGAERAVRALSSEYVGSFVELFTRRNGSVCCRDLTGGLDPSTAEGRQQIREQGRVEDVVAEAIRTLEQLVPAGDGQRATPAA
ncbi:C-GCAxxG-C-C family protein [Desulfogranum mediterraneum]|uniref:C-GCAxxG-C-C family protein n=1 Tax=Desulfogranum mediterraneum TaxID=160661 RepID=UPI0003F63058|nr:C-GCAxxG-C-C family protein [Desulfogranum mediterraneum]